MKAKSDTSEVDEAMPEESMPKDPAPEKPKGKEYAVQFQQNRSYDLHVGGAMYRFSPYESRPLPASVVNHPDFVQMSALFSVREVK